MARTHRASVRPVGVSGRHHASCPSAGTVHGSDFTVRSGCPYLAVIVQPWPSAHLMAGGMSARLPFGAPVAIHDEIVAICSSVRDLSFLNFWIPTVRSICHGGIWCVLT